MKTTKHWLFIFALTAYSFNLYAQVPKGLKYAPNALKGPKPIPAVINPRLPIEAQVRLAQNAPLVSTSSIERGVAQAMIARQQWQGKLVARLQTQLPILEEYSRANGGKLPVPSAIWGPATAQEATMHQVLKDVASLRNLGVKQHPVLAQYLSLINKDSQSRAAAILAKQVRILDVLPVRLIKLDAYMREHNGVLPQPSKAQQADDMLELLTKTKQDIKFLQSRGLGEHPLVVSFNNLCETSEQNRLKNARMEIQQQLEDYAQYAWRRSSYYPKFRDFLNETQRDFRKQEREWKRELAQVKQEVLAKAQFEQDVDVNAAKAAQRAESVLFLPDGAPTEEFVDELLTLYEKMDPLGENAFDASVTFCTPAQWAHKLYQFIEENHRLPARNDKKITNQQTLDEYRLASAISGLTNRLPADNPDRQRIEQLIANVGVNE
ncbi:MAG: hypothetical protein IJ266_04215 [Elusimicrobiaceae bacterium]|nr:hypothetical protein [Elusimicrobiaceae bacterium]